MHIEDEELERALEKFSGELVNLQNETEFKRFSLGFYPQNTNPFFHTDIKLDLSVIYQNYRTYHKIEGSSFNAFLYYHLIKTMQAPEFSLFRYRYINDKWYCFNNLPFYVSVTVGKESGQQQGFFIEGVGTMTWPEFVRTYRHEINSLREGGGDPVYNDLSWYGLTHMITSMSFPFSSYLPSQKNKDHNAEAPWFVIGQREEHDGKVECTLSCTVSHSSGLPSELGAFKDALIDNLSVIPANQKITRYFNKI
jgi:chloramphenicol O-acetyltransferase